MVKLVSAFSKISPQKILLAGDLLLDTYTIGKVGRISPEAPVPVLHVKKEENRPGGSGNAALNLVSMGAEVTILGRVGSDKSGEQLIQALKNEKIDVRGIIEQRGFPTPVKNRVIANNQQIVRIDYEEITPIPLDLEKKAIAMLPELLEGVKIVAISDYGKGFLSLALLKALISHAKERGIAVIVDPKGYDFSKYRGATIIKPNLSEVFAAANLTMEAPLHLAAERVLQSVEAEILMVTRSEAGISLFHKDGIREDYPVQIREVNDVTGAGDTVLAMLTCALASGLSIGEAAQLSNIAAGIAIEHFGCARVTLSQLARRLLQDNVQNKVFDEDHLFVLQEALRFAKYAVLEVSGKQGLTSEIFKKIKEMKKVPNRDLVVHIHDAKSEDEFVSLISSLNEVDFILLERNTFNKLCATQTPELIGSTA
jgi:rfaE bifunctional protein kinase chain/domain